MSVWSVVFLLNDLFYEKKLNTFSFLNLRKHRCSAISGTLCLCKECVTFFHCFHGLVLLKYFQN